MIVITTPTGLIGHQVLERVLEADEPVRVIVRDPSRLPPQALERVEVIEGSHGDAGGRRSGVRRRRLGVLAGAAEPDRADA